jgi:hypothetical protein
LKVCSRFDDAAFEKDGVDVHTTGAAKEKLLAVETVLDGMATTPETAKVAGFLL